MSNLVDVAKISADTPKSVPTMTINKTIAKEALIMNRFATLADEFKQLTTTTKDVNTLAAKVKEMRIQHGKIVESFFKTMGENGKTFTEQEYYVLSTLDSSMSTTRNILNEAEAFIGMPNKEVTISTGTSSIAIPLTNVPLLGGTSAATPLLGGTLIVDNDLPSVVLFYADWCSHCTAFKPIWNAFEKTMEPYKNKINILKTNDEAICSDFGVNGYPTIKFFQNIKLKQGIEYNSREPDYLVNHTKELAGLLV